MKVMMKWKKMIQKLKTCNKHVTSQNRVYSLNRHGFFIWGYFLGFLVSICMSCTNNAVEHLPEKENHIQPSNNDSVANAILLRAVRFLDKGDNTGEHDQLTKQELAQLQYGDIILRKGFGIVSDFIADYLNEPYPVTHCAFYFENERSKPCVLHCISNDSVNGIFTEPLRQYITDSQLGSLVALRVKTDTIGIHTYMNHAFDLLDRKIPFDMAFDDSDSSKMYCVEMMRHTFYPVFGRDILYKRADHLGIHVTHMDNFFNDTFFTPIFNHFESNLD